MSQPTPTTDNYGETIGVSDYLTPYVKRINAAIAYTGDNDHEDVISILKEFGKAYSTAQLHTVLVKLKKYAVGTDGNVYFIKINKRELDELLRETTLGDSEVT